MYMVMNRVPDYIYEWGKHSKPHVVQVGEDEGLIDIEPTGNDVLGILVCQPVGLIDC